MSSIKPHNALLLLMFLLAVNVGSLRAQAPNPYPETVSELGMMGGGGVLLTPTTGVMPESDFRLGITRLAFGSFSGKSGRGLSTYSMTGGISPKFEVAAKYQTAENGTPLAQAFFGCAAKLISPISLPGVDRSAFWGEVISTSVDDASAFFPTNLVHIAMIAAPAGLEKLNVHLLAGYTNADAQSGLLAGANGAVNFSTAVKLGGEIAYNYFGQHDWMESAVLSFRPVSNVCFQLSPGLFEVAGSTTTMISFGMSFTTANIEFVAPEKPKERSLVPSFDDLENEIQNGKKDEKKDNQ